MIHARLLSVVAGLSALILVASGCGDDSTLEGLIDEIETANPSASPTSTSDGSDPDTADSSTPDPANDDAQSADSGPADDPALADSEQALIDHLSGGASVSDAEARCLVDGLAGEGIAPADVVAEILTVDDEIVVADVIFSCFDRPESLATFVEIVAAGFADLVPFELEPDEAACAIAAAMDHGVTAAQVAESDLSPELIDELNVCIGIDPSIAFELGDVYGDNPVLDALWDECGSGIMASCDELYAISEIGSEYEAFGASCGDREPDSSGGACDVPFSYGDNAELDAYWDACEAGDGAACDDLYFESPIGSEYEAFGESCGNRHEGTQSYCVDLLVDP